MYIQEKQFSPKLVVKDGNIILKEGTDYKVTSKTGANAGDATITLTGQGWYKGTLDVKYTIAKSKSCKRNCF